QAPSRQRGQLIEARRRAAMDRYANVVAVTAPSNEIVAAAPGKIRCQDHESGSERAREVGRSAASKRQARGEGRWRQCRHLIESARNVIRGSAAIAQCIAELSKRIAAKRRRPAEAAG